MLYYGYSKGKGNTQMTTYTINAIQTTNNAGIAREWALCHYYKVERTSHDHTAYDKDSDLNVGKKHISIKASGFTLMSGGLCEGRETFDSIWELYESKVHSNTFAYITADYTVYEMNLKEFKKFVYKFCGLDRESSKNGGKVKIKARKESGKMLRWLAENVG